MATKNIFKKHAQLFIKSRKQRNVVIERVNETCYVSDGFTMLKLPYCFYMGYLNPLHDIFVNLEKGEKVLWTPKKKVCEISKDDSLARIYNSVNAEQTVEFTNIKIEVDVREYRIAKIDNRIAAINNDFYKAIKDYANLDGNCKSGGVTSIMKFEDGFIGCLIMPIRPHVVIEALRKITGAHNL